MAINNIKEYLIERLLDLDPTLSSSQGSLMFVKVIEPLINRLGTDPIAIDVESFVTQRLKDEFPELDVASPGSVLRDVIVAPLVVLLEPVRREVEFLRTQQSLANQSALSEAELDALLANVFSERSLGDYARGIVRVYFSSPAQISLDPSIVFTASSGSQFVPESSSSLSSADFVRSGSQYYLDVDVRSTVPTTDGNVGVGEVNRVTGLANVVRVTNLSSFSGGVSTETNEEFLERAERSLSERSLNTKRGIETALLNSFSDLVSIDVVGFGETDMQRDILQGDATFDLTESTGPMTYMTSDWKTHNVLSPVLHNKFPFTNTVIIPEPGSGWNEETLVRIQNAKYIRIADGASTNFDHRLLGRVRIVDEVVVHTDNNVYIRTGDFELYPNPPSITEFANPSEIYTNNFKQGLNWEPSQGSNYRLYVEIDGEDRVIGSHLPFTDIIETDFTSDQIPGSVIKGRDFLVVATANMFNANTAHGDIGIELPLKIRTYPLTRFFNPRKLGIGRVDSFLLSRDRYLYRGLDSFEFDPTLTYCAINEPPKIIDFGAPKYSENPSQSAAFNGTDFEDGGRSPGATLEGKIAGEVGSGSVPDPNVAGQEIVTIAAPTHEADIILSNSVRPWDERGAQEGQYIALSLYGGGAPWVFDGTLNDVDHLVTWQGIGKVKRVGYGDRWRLRVEGLDWIQLEGGHGGFAPPASATVKGLQVGEADIGFAGVMDYPNPDGVSLYIQHPESLPLNYTLMFDSDGDGAYDAQLSVSVLERWFNPETGAIEPSSDEATRSIVKINADAASFVAPGADFLVRVTDKDGLKFQTSAVDHALCGTAEDFLNEVLATIEADKADLGDLASGGVIIEDNTGAAVAADNLTDTPSGQLVLRSMAYGDYPTVREWALRFVDAATESVYLHFTGVTVGEFSEVPTRNLSALMGQIEIQGNSQSDGLTFPYQFYIDPEIPDELIIRHTSMGTDGNGNSVAPVGDSFTIPEWDGIVSSAVSGEGNINGGFHAGFGPMLQVKGIVPDEQLKDPATLEPRSFGDLESIGYELLTVSPTPGTSDEISGSTANSNLAYRRHSTDSSPHVRVIIDFVDPDLGDELRFVLQDNGLGELSQNAATSTHNVNYPDGSFSGKVVYNSGKVTIDVVSIDFDTIPDSAKVYASYSYFYHPYKLSWTLYRGELEVIDSRGLTSMSYDDLVFAPAFKNPLNLTQDAGPSGYDGSGFISGSTGISDWEPVTGQAAYGHWPQAYAVWIRLGKPFNYEHPSIGSSPSAYIKSAEFTNTQSPVRAATSKSLDYIEARYGDTDVAVKTSLPLTEGSMAVHFDDDGVPEHTGVSSPINNSKALTGFLIPVPMGTSSYDDPDFTTPNPITDGDHLQHQVLQLFEGTPDDFGDTKIHVSGIPGSVPLPGYTAVNLEVESNSIHIGGMTDIYVKPMATTGRTTPVINMSPASPLVGTDEGGDVVLQASDGIVNPSIDATHFFSAELESTLTSVYGAAPACTPNLVLELIEPPSAELRPTFVRVIHSVPGGCKIAGQFPEGLDAGFENLRFRVVEKVTTSLNRPLSILQQGEDLSITENESTVHLSGGVEFSVSPENVGMYISIDSETGKGEYSVVGRNLNSLILDRVMTESASGLKYRIYTKQSSGVDLPLVRVKEVSLSGDSTGVKVPYARPVDIVGSSFAGLNDDPINEDVGSWDGGDLKNETVTIDGEAQGRCTFYRPGADFKALGIIRYDVLVLPNLDGDLRHWYIDSVEVGDDGLNSLLILDRSENLSGPVSETPFTIGKPSIGTASIKFIDRTFFEVNTQHTLFCYKEPTTGKKYYLRPSPAESALIYTNAGNKSDVRIYGDDSTGLITTEDFFRYGIIEGDRLRIVSKVLKSDEFNGDLLEHENLMVSGKTLAVKIENTLKTVTFSGPNPVSLESVVNDINQQLGSSLRAEVVSELRDDSGDGVDETYYRIMIHSSKDVEIVHQGTIGIVELLKFEADMDNTPPVDDFIDEFTVESVSYYDAATYSDATPRTKITIDRPISGAPLIPTDFETVFIEIVRDRHQRVYPADMVADANGLYSADVKLTSFDPNTAEGIVPEDGQLEVENYISLGYHLEVENSNYSYSMGEKVDISATALILHDTASSLKDAYEVAGSSLTVSYDTSQTVAALQSYVLNPNVRVLCNNPLVRHYFPAYPVMALSYAGNMSTSSVQERISQFLSSLYPNKPLEVYSLVSMLSRFGVSYLQSPQEVGFVVHDENRNITVKRDKNRITLTKKSHVMENMDLVTINKVG